MSSLKIALIFTAIVICLWVLSWPVVFMLPFFGFGSNAINLAVQIHEMSAGFAGIPLAFVYKRHDNGPVPLSVVIKSFCIAMPIIVVLYIPESKFFILFLTTGLYKAGIVPYIPEFKFFYVSKKLIFDPAFNSFLGFFLFKLIGINLLKNEKARKRKEEARARHKDFQARVRDRVRNRE